MRNSVSVEQIQDRVKIFDLGEEACTNIETVFFTPKIYLGQLCLVRRGSLRTLFYLWSKLYTTKKCFFARRLYKFHSNTDIKQYTVFVYKIIIDSNTFTHDDIKLEIRTKNSLHPPTHRKEAKKENIFTLLQHIVFYVVYVNIRW